MKKRHISYLAAAAITAILLLMLLLFPGMGESMPRVVLPDLSGEIAAQPHHTLTAATMVSIDRENIRAIVGQIDRALSYSKDITLTTYWEGGSLVRRVTVAADRDRLHVTETTLTGTKSYLLADNVLYIWYNGDEASHITLPGAAIDALPQPLSLNEGMEIPSDSIITASFTDYDNRPCVYLEYITPYLGYTDCVYIDISSGVTISEECYDGDALVYTAHSDNILLTAPDSALFRPPRG